MITLVFLNQGFLIQPETIAALRKIPTLRCVSVDITSHPNAEQAEFLTKILSEQQCRILFTINEWGIDTDGIIQKFLEKNQIMYVNWFVDDPFYEEIILKKKFRPYKLRIDFVSDKDYLQKMKDRGYNAFFLPLGTDSSIFYNQNFPRTKEIVFVGNSYIQQMDELLVDADELILPMTSFLASVINSYNHDNNTDIECAIVNYLEDRKLPDKISFERAVFIAKHFVGYLYRKQIVTGLVKEFAAFSIIGDAGWKKITDPQRVSKVGYYNGLRELYNTSKINVDINRVVIRNGFTQRTFDTLACKCFCVTGAKPVVQEFFNTEGEEKELVTFRNSEELHDLVRYYLIHESEREKIAERGFKKVLSLHTYDNRVAEIFKCVQSYL